MSVGSLVEIADVVISNMVMVPDRYYPLYADVYVETSDRTAGMLVRLGADEISTVWDSNAMQFKFQRGDAVRVVGAISKDDPNNDNPPQPDTKNPVKYISGWAQGIGLPAVIATGDPQVELKPVALNSRSLIGDPIAPGLTNDGMLVTVAGRVNHSMFYFGQPSYFYVDDGSGLVAGKPEWNSTTNATGVRIDCRALILDPYWWGAPLDGSFATVTGTCTAELNPNDHATVVRVVYPRQAADIVTVPD